MSNFFRKLLTFSCLLFTGVCFLKAGAGLVSNNSPVSLPRSEAAVLPSVTQPRLQTTPIQQMRPGMRVLGRNPDRWDTQPVVEPDPVSWRLVSVRMEQQPGKFVLGQLLRSTSWIRQNNALPGAVIQLEIPEMHVAGDAEVLSIADCPPIRRGPGSVVTGTFQHVSDEVISVFVEGESEPIGATSQHPFWSRDRNAFVPAGELRIGEELKTALGTSTRVTSIEIRAGPETVYGLEVAGEHVYQITHAGLLVHNASGKGRKTPIEELLQDVYDANSFKTITAGKHHLSPKAVANDLRYGHKSLTDLNSFKHTVLQGALDDFLLNKTKLLADGRVVHMKPQTGNSGRTVRANFTLQERIDALDEFYSSFVEGRYYPAFRMELNAAKKTGKLR